MTLTEIGQSRKNLKKFNNFLWLSEFSSYKIELQNGVTLPVINSNIFIEIPLSIY